MYNNGVCYHVSVNLSETLSCDRFAADQSPESTEKSAQSYSETSRLLVPNHIAC